MAAKVAEMPINSISFLNLKIFFIPFGKEKIITAIQYLFFSYAPQPITVYEIIEGKIGLTLKFFTFGGSKTAANMAIYK